jgi:hypothetical protein
MSDQPSGTKSILEIGIGKRTLYIIPDNLFDAIRCIHLAMIGFCHGSISFAETMRCLPRQCRGQIEVRELAEPKRRIETGLIVLDEFADFIREENDVNNEH